MLILHSKTNF